MGVRSEGGRPKSFCKAESNPGTKSLAVLKKHVHATKSPQMLLGKKMKVLIQGNEWFKVCT